MKKSLLVVGCLLFSVYCMAQEDIAFPFQGGKGVMTRFFKDSITVTPDIIAKKATGMAIFKFTADESGNLSKIVIYYADDLMLTPPIIAALKKTHHKWIVLNHEKFHDFIIPFSVNFNIPLTGNATVQKAAYDFYLHRRPFPANDQIPLNEATLLPTMFVNYNIQ